MTYIAGETFLVNNKKQSHKDGIKKLIANEEMPTELVHQRERLGGLRYADKKCWEFFGMVEYVYTTIATAEFFICGGRKLLGELASALLSDKELRWGFSLLCDYIDDSEFSFDDTTTSF